MSKTACVVPWSTFIIGPDGRVSFCCDVPEPLEVNGRMGSIYRDSLEELWNADKLVAVRAAIARGERPATCHLCWEREAAGGVSRRLLSNTVYRYLGGRLAVDEVAREGAESGYRLERRPDWFILQLGNVCNLRCRSCSPLYSTRIAADPVAARWSDGKPAEPPAGAAPPADAELPADAALSAGGASTPPSRPRRPRLQLAPAGSSAWFEDVDTVADMIASGAEGNAMLSLMGGEPFLIDRTWRLLEALVARGVASRLVVALATNGQQRRAELEELAPRFRRFNLSLSIDAHGKLYEYLRYGASWRRLVENLAWFRQVPNLDLSAVPTLQNGNALDIVTLLRFLDRQDLRLAYNVLTSPARLRPTNLPPSVRRISAQRLHGYLAAECRPENLTVVRGYCEALEEAGDDFDADLFKEFMTFTDELDADRAESLRSAAPELAALIRAAGAGWPPEGGRGTASPDSSGFSGFSGQPLHPDEILRRVNRTVAARDALFAGFESVEAGAYFSVAPRQLAEIDGILRQHGHPGLTACTAVADFACHYGRLTRALLAALPHAAVYACDIDRGALEFCAAELGAQPVMTGWKPDEQDDLPDDLDAILCVSLLTHTTLEHWRRVLRAWARALRPGGVAAFTFLSDRHFLAPWLAGEMGHYGTYSSALRAAVERGLREDGFGFAALTAAYGGEPRYGIAFASHDVVRREIAAAGLELVALPQEASPTLGQDLVVVRKAQVGTVAAPDAQDAHDADAEDAQGAAPAAAVRRDVSVVALYDPRCYAPGDAREGSHAASVWARLVAACPPRPLPTELGFGDPRVPEVRAAQAALAREHGIDAFCYLYAWAPTGPRWDAPWRDLVASGQPDFPFCLMLTIENGALLGAAEAGRLFDDIAPGLGDRRYLHVDGRALLIVRDLSRLVDPQAVAAVWRAAAAAAALGEIHLCAGEPAPADDPGDLGFDSFLAAAPAAIDPAATVAAALARPWPRHRLFRTVECRRDAADPHAVELYEHWLRSAVDATRRRGEPLVFLDAWNDWLGGLYLEPDDRDGRAALLATRRAVRGPGSGLVLLRLLRDALSEIGEVGDSAAALLGELGQVLALHEHTRDRLLASVEAALGRSPASGPDPMRWVPVASRLLPPSGGGFCLDRVGSAGSEGLQEIAEPIPLCGDEISLAGWAHAGQDAPGDVSLFVAFESANATDDRIFRVTERVERTDVAAAFPGHPARCGFDTTVSLVDLAPGTYRIAIVQRTPRAAYRDATGVTVRRDGAPCSSG
jgi:MoaA/NifB/PqqE/SkfB family radical SAM enzyme/SAM-dependent methyltransferase